MPARPGGRCGERASLVGLWWAGEPVFDAGVRVCAPVLADGRSRPDVGRRRPRSGGGRGRAVRRRGRARRSGPVPRSASSWSPLLGVAARHARASTSATGPTLADARRPRRPGSATSTTASCPTSPRQCRGTAARRTGRAAGDQRADRPVAVPVGLDLDPLRPHERGRAPVVDLDRAARQPTPAWPPGPTSGSCPRCVVASQTRVARGRRRRRRALVAVGADHRRGARHRPTPPTSGGSPPCWPRRRRRPGRWRASAARRCRATRSSSRPRRCSACRCPPTGRPGPPARRPRPTAHAAAGHGDRRSAGTAALEELAVGHGRRLRGRTRRSPTGGRRGGRPGVTGPGLGGLGTARIRSGRERRRSARTARPAASRC